MKVRIQHLNSTHDRSDFDCGNEALNRWLATTASQHQEKGFSRTFVLVDTAAPTKILGFYSLVSAQVMLEDYPTTKRLPRVIPVVRIARLAVALDGQGKGFGADLLMNALRRIHDSIASNMGVHAVVVDAKDEQAAAFYEKYGFVRSPSNTMMLFMPVASIP